MKKLRVTVDGKTYEVTVDILEETVVHSAAPAPVVAPASVSAPVAPVAAAPAPAPAAPKAAAPAGAGTVPSPLAGKIVSVDVKVGDTVAEGAQLVTLEAMKMNTYVYAPRAGKVATVHVAPGDAVEEAGPLVTLA